MKGAMYTMQEVLKIKVILKLDDKGKDLLEFGFRKPEFIYLNTEKSTSMENVFAKMLEIMLDKKIELELEIDKEYTKKLFIDVVTSYIDDLNKEIKKIVFE
jgi:hypothetical protein